MEIKLACLIIAVTLTHYVNSTLLNCVPKDTASLSAEWADRRVSESCHHESFMMLPVMGALMDYKQLNIPESSCRNREEACDDTTRDYLCAYCPKPPTPDGGQVLPDSCSTVLPDDAVGLPIEITAGCTWHYEMSYDKYRYPPTLVDAVCHECDSCNLDSDDIRYRCEAIIYDSAVLYAVNRTYSDGDLCEYALRYQPLSSGCTCALAPSDGTPQGQHSQNEAQQEEDAENSHVIAQVNDDNDIDNQDMKISLPQENNLSPSKLNRVTPTLKPQPKLHLKYPSMDGLFRAPDDSHSRAQDVSGSETASVCKTVEQIKENCRKQHRKSRKAVMHCVQVQRQHYKQLNC